jgi:O-antigen/teichoic acid export membrane protein
VSNSTDVIQGAELPDGTTPSAVVVLHAGRPPSLHEHARERNRRLISSMISGLLIKPLGLLAPLITARLFVKYLHPEGYGLYETIIAMSALLSLTNAGLTLGLVNRLMDCHVSGDRELARRYISSLLFTLAGIVLVALAIWTLVAAFTHWDRVFETTDPFWRSQVPMVVWITGASVLCGLIFSMPMTIYQAYQELTIANIWDGVSKLVTFGACVAVVYTHFGLIGVAVASAAVPTAVTGFNTLWLFGRKPWLRPRLASFDWRLVKSTILDGLLLLVIQSSIVLIFQCDKLIIGTAINPAAVTQYALLGRLFTMGYSVYMILLMPLWPAYGEALRRGDWPWVRHKLRISLIFGCGICAACGAVLLIRGDQIFQLWTRGQVNHVSHSLVLALTATFVLRAWVDSRTVILHSVNILLPQVYFFAAHAILNLILALVLSRRFGPAGVAWATPITALLTSVWGYPWLLRREAAKSGHSAF